MWIIVTPVLLVLIVIATLQIPKVQTFATGKATDFLSKKIKTKVELGGINITFPKSISLTDLYVEDEKADTLLYSHSLKVDINLWDLISKKIVLNSIELETLTGHIYRDSANGKFNFSFIPEAFSSGEKDTIPDTDTTGTPLIFSIKNVSLKNIYFTFHDKSSGMNADLHLGSFETHLDEFDLNKKIIHVNTVDIKSTRAFVTQQKPLNTKKDTSASEPFDFDIGLNKLKLENIQATYRDPTSGQDLAVVLGEFMLDVKKIDLKNEKIDLSKLALHSTNIYYTQNKVAIQDTIAKAVEEQVTGKSPDWTVTLGDIDLAGNTLGYDNRNAAEIKNSLDFNHLLIKDFTFQGNDLYANVKKIDFKLKDLHFTEQSGFRLKKFQADISYDTVHAELKNLDLQINNSRITNHLALAYPSLKTLGDSINQLGVKAEFKNTSIAMKDILYFSPGLLEKLPLKKENKNAVVQISGKINGKVNDLDFKNLEVHIKENTAVKLDGTLRNVTDPKNLYASASFEFMSTKKDIQSLLLDSLIPKTISLPERLSLKGTYAGYVKNFDTDLEVKTSFGNVSAKVKMNPKAGNNEQPYSGKIDIAAFDLGKLLNQPKTLGPVTLTASVKGSGFDTSNINTEIHVGLVKAFFKNYDYKNFNLDGKLVKKSFNGSASMKDDNLAFDFKGGADLEPTHPKYTFTLDLKGADLKALNLSETDLRISALIQSDLGNEAGKNPTGMASLRNALVIRGNKKFPIDSIVLISEVKDGVSDFRLRSELMTANLKGNVHLSELPDLLKQHLGNYFNMQDAVPAKTLAKQQFTFDLNINDPYAITENFVPQVEKLSPIAIKGAYDSEARDLMLNVDVPQIKYSGILVDSIGLNIKSDPQKLGYALTLAEVSNPTLKFENVYLGGEIKNNTLEFQFNIAKDDSAKLFAIGGVLKSLNKDFELKLDQKLILDADNWNIDNANYLHFGKEGMYANNIAISNAAQSLVINSKEKKPQSPLELSFKNFEITSLSRMIENKKELAKGKINGNVILEKQNGASAFKSDLVIKDFVFQSVPVGTIKLKASNYEDPTKYDVDLGIQGNGNDIAVKGFYKASKTNDLDILLDIRNLNLASIEPFTFNQVTNMSGSINGKLNLKGQASLPAVEGSLRFKEAEFRPKFIDSYLKVTDSKIDFVSKKITFDNFTLKDTLDHTATLNGDINISDLKSIELDLRLKTKDFLALNTTSEDNPLYYGKIILDSDIKIKGTTDAPDVDAKIKINKGSSITYVKPESLVSKNESKGVVEFVNPDEKDISIMARRNDSIDANSKIKGIELNASVNFDKSVQLKMIVDRSSGDSLYIQGGGLLDFALDRSGKTSLSGKYNIEDGGYFLSLENVVKRSFKIQPGSSVTWSGDPLDAYVDLTAIYTIKTSPLDLVQNELAGLSEMEKNKYRNLLTFMVYLKMNGFLTSPEISFDIELAPSDRGALNGAVNTKLANLREDETQLNKQVFALLTLRRFIGENPLESSGGGGLSSTSRSTASKALTQQLSSLSDKYVSFVNLDLGVNSFEDYSSGQAEGRTQLQVGVSKQLFNEKVTVRVGGNVDLEGEKASQNSANDVAGNISIDYKLTEDGRYKLEASRENQYENPIEGELTKTAAGVVYTRNFNTFKQLFSKPKSAKEKQEMKRLKKKEKLEKEKQEKKDQEQAQKPTTENL